MESAFERDPMVLIAIMVSRVEALIVTNMLEAAGIYVRADGIHHASVSVNSIALGGHRLWVPNFQYEEASAIIREVGLPDNDVAGNGPRKAIFRLLGSWFGVQTAAFLASSVFVGTMPIFVLLELAVGQALTLPVNPQGRADFYLAPEE